MDNEELWGSAEEQKEFELAVESLNSKIPPKKRVSKYENVWLPDVVKVTKKNW